MGKGDSKEARAAAKALHEAIRDNDTKSLNKALKSGVDLTLPWKKKLPLAFAAERGNDGAVRRLLKAGAPIDPKEKKQWTPLICAATHGHTKVVKTLLAAGADPDRLANQEWDAPTNALCAAANKLHLDVMEALIDGGANIHAERPRDDNALSVLVGMTLSLWAQIESPLYKVPKRRQEVYRPSLKLIRKLGKQGVKVRGYYLAQAARSGNEELVALLLELGGDPNSRTHGGRALTVAAHHNHKGIVQRLLKAGAKLDEDDENESDPLIQAVAHGHFEIAQELIAAGANLEAIGTEICRPWDQPDREFKESDVARASTALVIAVRCGNADMVKLLVAAGSNVEAQDSQKRSAMTWAKRLKNKEIISLLGQAGAIAPEFAEGSPVLALLRAARLGNLKKLDAALAAGVDVNILHETDEHEHLTPLMCAAAAGKAEMVKRLLKLGADVNLCAATCKTPLMYAAEQGHDNVIALLIKAGAKVGGKDRTWDGGGQTALHYAAEKGHAKAVELLLKHDASPKAKSSGGPTPLMLAAGAGNARTVKTLLRAGADPNELTKDGMGPLACAAQEGRTKVVETLLIAGADPEPNIRDKNLLPLKLASLMGRAQVVRLLTAVAKPADLGSLLIDACIFGRLDEVGRLLKEGADPNGGEDGFTPLMACVRAEVQGATEKQILPVVAAFLKAGAEVNAMNKSGETALNMAKQQRLKQVMEALKKGGGLTGSEVRKLAREAEKKAGGKKKSAPKKRAKKVKAPEFLTEEQIDELRDYTTEAGQLGKKFEQAVKALEKKFGTPENEREPWLRGSFDFKVDRSLSESLLTEEQDRLLKKGMRLYRHSRSFRSGKDGFTLVPDTDWRRLLRCHQTCGPNFEIYSEDVIKWLEELERDQPFEIIGAGHDWCEARFLTPPQNTTTLARRMYEICPDIIDQGMGTLPRLAHSLKKQCRFAFWWD